METRAVTALAESPLPAAQLGAARASELASVPTDQDHWDALEERLVRWTLYPHELKDDGFEPPTPGVLDEARRFVAWMRQRSDEQQGLRLTRVAPDGDGGLAFEHINGNETIVVEFMPDGAEVARFLDGRLVSRSPLRA